MVACAQLVSLKEWAPTCAALGGGDQTVILRKGGVREPTFFPEAGAFLLFPTSFHTDAQLLKPEFRLKYAEELACEPKALPELSLRYYAEVTGAWTTPDPSVLSALNALHAWTPEFLDARLRWRQQQPITVLELRVYRLAEPIMVASREEFWGCFSWVDLGEEAAASLGATALQSALSDAAFAERQALCRRALEQLGARSLKGFA